MFKVTVRGPDGSETNYPLGPDQGLIVGRDETCDIVLASKRISRRHARFFASEGKLHIEDLGSQNGIFVGGARVSGTVEIRPGPPIEIGEFSVRIRREDLTSDENSYAGVLQGFATTEGRTLNLPKERGVIGRDDSADIVIQSDSVSRRHAELRYAGLQGYYVQDLGSANGTYVNGARLPPKIERPLRPNDRIQFGDTGWLVVPKSAVAEPVSEKARRRTVLYFVLTMVALTVGVVYFILNPIHINAPAPPPKIGKVEAPSIDRCNQAIADQKWSDAERFCAEAYAEEPFADRRRLLRTAQRELHFKEIYDDATRKASIGSDRDAVERFFDIDEGSSFFPQARLTVQGLAKGLMRTDDITCHEAARKHNNDKVVESCRSYLRYQCHNGVDADALKLLRAAEKGKSGPAWECPTAIAIWFTHSGPTIDRKTYCEPKYADKDMCDAIVAYAKEKVDDAQRLLGKIKKGKMDDLVQQLREAMTTVQGHYKQGQSSLTANDFGEAEKAYKVALDADTKIMQAGVESDYAKDMRDALVAHYRQIGDQARDRQNLPEAFQHYSQGAQYRPTLNLSIEDLERIGTTRFVEAKTCDTARAVANFTRESSSIHQAVAKFISEHQCP